MELMNFRYPFTPIVDPEQMIGMTEGHFGRFWRFQEEVGFGGDGRDRVKSIILFLLGDLFNNYQVSIITIQFIY